MAKDAYFENSTPFLPGTVIKSSEMNAKLDMIASGFTEAKAEHDYLRVEADNTKILAESISHRLEGDGTTSSFEAVVSRLTIAETELEGRARASDLLTVKTRVDGLGVQASAMVQRLSSAESDIAGKAKAADLTTVTTKVENQKLILESAVNRLSKAESDLNSKSSASDMTEVKASLQDKATKNDLSAAVTRLSTAEADIQGKASAADQVALVAKVNSPTIGLDSKASLTALNSVSAELSGKASAKSVLDLSASVANKADNSSLSATNTRVIQAEVELGKRALSSDVNTMKVDVNTANSSVTALSNRVTKTEADVLGKASASSLTTLEAKVISQGDVNLIDLSGWKMGSFAWPTNSGTNENAMVTGVGPDGHSSVLWQCIPSGDGGGDGGWEGHNTLSIDPTKTYRFAVPVCKEGLSTYGTAWWGVQSGTVCDLNTANTNLNPYFAVWAGLELNKWYLAVGYVFPAGSTGNTNDGAGWFDLETGQLVQGGVNYCWFPGQTLSGHRAYLFYCNSAVPRQYFAPPEVTMVGRSSAAIPKLSTLGATKTELAARIDTVNKAIVDATAGKASAESLTALDARVVANSSVVAAQVSRLDSVVTDVAGKASASSVQNLAAQVSNAATKTELQAQVNRIDSVASDVLGKASASSVQTLEAKVNNAATNTALGAQVSRLDAVVADVAGKASASSVTNLAAQVSNAATKTELQAQIGRIDSVVSDVSGKASASSVQTLSTTVGQQAASITQVSQAQATTEGKLLAKWAVVLSGETADGRKKLSGLQAFNDGVTSGFVITADQLLIGDLSNLVSDPNYMDLAWWGRPANHPIEDGDAPGWAKTARRLLITPAFNGESISKPFPVTPGAVYRLEVIVYNNNAVGSLKVHLHIPGIRWAGFDGSYSDAVTIVGNGSSPGSRLFSSEVMFPANAALSASSIRIVSNISSGNWVVGLVSVVRVSDSTLIAGGAVTAEKIKVDTLQAVTARTGNLIVDGGGSICSGGFINAWSWPAAGTTGFHLSGRGLLMGSPNYANGAFFHYDVTTGDLILYKGTITAATINAPVINSAEINGGVVKAVRVQNYANNNFVDFNAVGDQPFISCGDAVSISARGKAKFFDIELTNPVLKRQIAIASGVATPLDGIGAPCTYGFYDSDTVSSSVEFDIDTGTVLQYTPQDFQLAYTASVYPAGGMETANTASYAMHAISVAPLYRINSANNTMVIRVRLTFNRGGNGSGLNRVGNVAWTLYRFT